MSDGRLAGLLGRQSAHKKSRRKPGDESDEALGDDADEKDPLIDQKRQRARVLQPLQMLLNDEACDRNCREGPQSHPGAPLDKRGTCEREEREDKGDLWEVAEITMQVLPRCSGDRIRELVPDQDSEHCQRSHEQPRSQRTPHAQIMTSASATLAPRRRRAPVVHRIRP